MVYLGTYPINERWKNRRPSVDAWSIWNYEEGQNIRVVCYTNAASAKLLLNGALFGETKNYDEETGIIFWDLPYKPGKLEVIGMDANEKQVSQYSIQTSERPDAIKIISKETTIKKGGLAQVIIQVVDENGIPVMLSDDEITCRIDGDAHLLGMEASNNSDMSDYTDNKQRVFHGRMIVYLKAGESAGEFTVRFSGNWLKPAETKINIK